VAEAELEVEPRVDRAAPQRLHFGHARASAERAFAFALQPELVDVAAIPALRVPGVAVAAVSDARLEPVDEQLADPHRAMLLAQPSRASLHAAAPSSGRTVTTRIMPACMW
jgi:hypothetical protein